VLRFENFNLNDDDGDDNDDDDGHDDHRHQQQRQKQPSTATPHGDIDGIISLSTSHPSTWKHPSKFVHTSCGFMAISVAST